MDVAEVRMLRWTCDKIILDMIPNGAFRRNLQIATIVNKMREGRLRWFRHVKRRPQSTPVKKVSLLPLIAYLREEEGPPSSVDCTHADIASRVGVIRDLRRQHIPSRLIPKMAKVPGMLYGYCHEYVKTECATCRYRALICNVQINVQSLSSHERIMALDLPHGGHISHGYQAHTKKKITREGQKDENLNIVKLLRVGDKKGRSTFWAEGEKFGTLDIRLKGLEKRKERKECLQNVVLINGCEASRNPKLTRDLPVPLSAYVPPIPKVAHEGNTRKNKGFWVEIVNHMHSTCSTTKHRTYDMINEKWITVHPKVATFVVSKKCDKSSSVEVLECIAQSEEQKSKRYKSSDNSSFNTRDLRDGNFNFNSTVGDEEDEMQEVRPSRRMGTDQTKRKRKARTSSASSTGFDVESLAKLMVNKYATVDEPHNVQKGQNMTELLQMKKI
ncbi:retrovirus-related pol polyprotein from transposon TNT 1-94 [Tanacetum coccineum]